MLRKVAISALIVSLNIVPPAARAEAYVYASVVHTLSINNSSVGIIIFSENIPGPPACAVDYPNRVAVNLATPGGQAMFAAALTAQTAGKNVGIWAGDTCALWSGSRDAVWLSSMT